MTGDVSRNLWLKYNTSLMRQIELHVKLWQTTDQHAPDSSEVYRALDALQDEEEAGAAILRNLAARDGVLLTDHFKALEELGSDAPPAEREKLTADLLAAFALPQIQH
jgi:ribosomal 50S subunit-associated protein YjgA (DUF615 family)